MTHWQIDTDQTTRYLQEMVRINSINPGLSPGGKGEGEVAAWLFKTCHELGLEVQMQETAPGRPNVIARWPGKSNGRSLLLTGHTDVVSTENMKGDPFDARIEDGKLYGRGSEDMKGGLASILGAVAALQTGGFQPAGDLWLGFVTDEEYESIGMDALVKLIHPDAAILTEPTDLRLCVAHKGFAWVTVSTRGFATHGSRYNDGVDAISHMGRVLSALDQMEREIFPQRTHPLLGRPSAHASLISGGLGWSTYPDACTLRVEHRILPDETAEETVAQWRETLDALHTADPKFEAEVTLDLSRPGYEISQDAEIVQALDSAYCHAVGSKPEYVGKWFWMDSAILGQAGIPTVIIGPSGEGAHAAVEYVKLDEVYVCAAVIAEAAASWLKG